MINFYDIFYFLVIPSLKLRKWFEVGNELMLCDFFRSINISIALKFSRERTRTRAPRNCFKVFIGIFKFSSFIMFGTTNNVQKILMESFSIKEITRYKVWSLRFWRKVLKYFECIDIHTIKTHVETSCMKSSLYFEYFKFHRSLLVLFLITRHSQWKQYVSIRMKDCGFVSSIFQVF